ncbi:MAG: heparinase II/III-family protein [Oligoflexia bacterium]|nr:heparinase II/III-family protein [Oligoflexia bacterium]
MPDRAATNEVKNFYRRSSALEAAVFLAGKGVSRLQRRLWPLHSARYYPSDVRAAWEEWRRSEPQARSAALETHPPHAAPRLALKITGHTLSPEDPRIWRGPFEDPEVEASLHRWVWLLHAFEEYPQLPHAWGTEQIRGWLEACGELPGGVASEPYTVSERISNYFLFSSCFFQHDQILSNTPKSISSLLHNSALYLASRIEYSGRYTSGNHPINNARALLFAARLFDLPRLYALAAAALRERLDFLTTPDGFLREGSSHYHFLITRWLLEIYGVERRRTDSSIRQWLGSYLRPLLERCWFYLVPSDSDLRMPLIGDISPDLPPTWLLCMPWSELAVEFSAPRFPLPLNTPRAGLKFWGGMSTALQARSSPDTEPQFFPKSHWYRLDRGRATVFWLAEPGEDRDRASHAHQDLLSFVLYLDGRPIFIDPGRNSYLDTDPLSSYGASAQAHNSLTLDGYPAVLKSWQTRFAPGYRQANVATSWSSASDQFTFTIQHNGFNRIAGRALEHRREFQLHSGGLRITDTLSGSGSYALELHFHLAPELQRRESLEAAATYLLSENVRVAIRLSATAALQSKASFGWTETEPRGEYCVEYGRHAPCHTLSCRCDTTLPATFKTEIDWS